MKKKQCSTTFLTGSGKDAFQEKLIARNVFIRQEAPLSAETGQK